MATKALLPYREENIGGGYFNFVNPGVKYGDVGISGLTYQVPIPQQQWTLETVSGVHTTSYVYDSATSRVYLRVLSTTLGTWKARIRLKLPQDHGTIITGGVEIYTRKQAAITSLKMTVERGGTADSSINGASIDPSATTTWELFQLSIGTAYSAGDWVTVMIEGITDTNNDEIWIADLSWKYRNTAGNV